MAGQEFSAVLGGRCCQDTRSSCPVQPHLPVTNIGAVGPEKRWSILERLRGELQLLLGRPGPKANRLPVTPPAIQHPRSLRPGLSPFSVPRGVTLGLSDFLGLLVWKPRECGRLDSKVGLRHRWRCQAAQARRESITTCRHPEDHRLQHKACQKVLAAVSRPECNCDCGEDGGRTCQTLEKHPRVFPSFLWIPEISS